MEHNWNRTVKINIRYKGLHEIEVLIFLSHDENGDEIIQLQSMMYEYFMTFEIDMKDKSDVAYSLIQNFPVKTIHEIFLQLAIDNGAIE